MKKMFNFIIKVALYMYNNKNVYRQPDSVLNKLRQNLWHIYYELVIYARSQLLKDYKLKEAKHLNTFTMNQ